MAWCLVSRGTGQTTKATPIYVIHEEISDVWVNVSMTPCMVKKVCGLVSSKQGGWDRLQRPLPSM